MQLIIASLVRCLDHPSVSQHLVLLCYCFLQIEVALRKTEIVAMIRARSLALSYSAYQISNTI